MAKAILVTGATGKQGGAVVVNLLDSDDDLIILAVTRSPFSAAAEKLAQKSSKIKLVQGNLNDPVTLFQKAKEIAGRPIWGVYLVQNPLTNKQSPEQEITEAKLFIDTAIDNGTKHFVYSSVDRGGDSKSFDNPTPVPHFISKFGIEHYLVDKAGGTNMKWTILRPASFMENYTEPGLQTKIFLTAWKVALGDHPQQLISVHDIGAQAFLHPEEYQGRGISLASDELTFAQADEIFREETGRTFPTTFKLVASAVLFLLSGIGAMFKWIREEGFGADIASLRRIHPGMKDFATFIRDIGAKEHN